MGISVFCSCIHIHAYFFALCIIFVNSMDSPDIRTKRNLFIEDDWDTEVPTLGTIFSLADLYDGDEQVWNGNPRETNRNPHRYFLGARDWWLFVFGSLSSPVRSNVAKDHIQKSCPIKWFVSAESVLSSDFPKMDGIILTVFGDKNCLEASRSPG